jgi:tetratricopeptide (TPR) repeat protein
VTIALPGRDKVPSGPRRDFAEALHDIYDLAGQPASRQISRAIFRSESLESVSHETVSALLRGRITAWGKVQSVVTVLARMSIRELEPDAVMTRFHHLWLAARHDEEAAALRAERTEPVDAPPRLYEAVATAEPAVLEPVVVETVADRIEGQLPDRNPRFTGRELLLDRMRSAHRDNPSAPLVLHGLGGVGKTQVAREYVHRYGMGYAVVWWAPADRAEQARASLVSLAERLGLPLRAGTEQTVRGVLRYLEAKQVNYLLVFDGVEGYDIRDLLPRIGGSVIVTSRDPVLAHDNTNVGIEVPDFDVGEAIQFLRKLDVAMSGATSQMVIESLGRLPLALEQLAALHLATEQSWEELLPQLDDPIRGLLTTEAPGPAHYPRTVAAFVRLAVEQLGQANPGAVLVLELFVWLGAEPVAMVLLTGGAHGKVYPPLKRILESPIELNRAVADIVRYGLGRLHKDQRLEVQPLTRLALRDLLTEDTRARVRGDAWEILVAADLGRPDDLAVWDLHRAMAPHVLPSGLVESRDPAALSAVFHQIRFRYLIGEYEDACRLGEAAVLAWQATEGLGPEHEMVLVATREWANAQRALGQYPQARELTAEAMARLRANPAFGEAHVTALDMARSHAADLRIAGEYQDAFELDERTYALHVLAYRPDDSRRTTSHSNLAVCYRLLGRFRDAENIDREELGRLGELRRKGDRKRLLAVNALAEDLFGLGRYREVLALRSLLPDGDQPALGAGDQGVLLYRRSIGLAQRRLGESTTAVASLRANYFECVNSFGQNHEYTLAAMMSYANALRDVEGMRDEAYGYAVQAVRAYERAFGPENPLTLVAQVNLAIILRIRGDRYQAWRADDAALNALRDRVGDRHPFVIVTMVSLAADMFLANDYSGAAVMAQEAYLAAHEILGSRHPDTLAAAANLAHYRAAGIVADETGPSLDDVLADLRHTLGQNHPMVADVAAGVRVECDIEPPSL